MVELQMECINSLSTWRAIKLFHGRMGVCGLGSFRRVLLSIVKDKTFLRQNCMDREYGGFSSILPHNLSCMI